MLEIEIRFLDVAGVKAIHRREVNKTREPVEVLSEYYLDSAVSSIKNAYWFGVTDHFRLAAKYAFAIAKAHAFVQGNKRTGLHCALTFLGANEHRISHYSVIFLSVCVWGMVENIVSVDEFAEYLRHRPLSLSTTIVIRSLGHYLTCQLRKAMEPLAGRGR